MVAGLKDVSSGRPLVSSAKLSAAAVQLTAPDITVTTPAALLNFLDVTEKLEEGKWYSPATFIKNIRHVVLDEVDVTLLGHENSCLRLLERIRVDDHRRIGFMAMVGATCYMIISDSRVIACLLSVSIHRRIVCIMQSNKHRPSWVSGPLSGRE